MLRWARCGALVGVVQVVMVALVTYVVILCWRFSFPSSSLIRNLGGTEIVLLAEVAVKSEGMMMIVRQPRRAR